MLTRLKKLAVSLVVPMAFSATTMASEVVVGGKNFTEQQLLTEITSQYLTDHGFEVERRAGMGSTVLRKAQENGQIDLYWEYTGTSLLNYNKVKEKVAANEVYQKVKTLDEQKGLIWLAPSAANNTYALAMRRQHADEANIHSLSDLARAVNGKSDLTIAVNAEFYARKDGLKPLQKAYGFAFDRDHIKRMDSGLTYTALKEEQVDVALVFATDGRIQAFDFVTLEDDKGYFPDYAITPVVRADTLKSNPALEELLNNLSRIIDNSTMRDLNARVDVLHMPIEQVARDFLQGTGLKN